MRWPTNKKQHAYMKMRADENKQRSEYNKAENWAKERLKETGLKWKRQARWGYRIFDFWNHYLGVAVEIDGNTHNKEYDEFRDRHNFKTSGIKVIRVRNFSEEDIRECIKNIKESENWNERRIKLRLKPITN